MIRTFLSLFCLVRLLNSDDKSINHEFISELLRDRGSVSYSSNISEECGIEVESKFSYDNITQSLGNNDSIFDSWRLGTQFDLWALEHWDLVVDDLRCKLGATENNSRQFCEYRTEKEPEPLETGFLFTFCIPASGKCTLRDAKAIGNWALQATNSSTSKDPDEYRVVCVPNKHESRPAGFYIMQSLTAILALTSIIASVLMCLKRLRTIQTKLYQKLRVFGQLFSFQSNFKKLSTANQETDHIIESAAFLKVLTMVFVVVCHVILLAQLFVLDVEEYRESYRSSFLALILYNGTYCIGTFFLISGMLNTFVVLRKLKHQTKQTENNESCGSALPQFSLRFWCCIIIHRYMRIVPLYLYCMLMFSYVFPYMIDFPFWAPMDSMRQCRGEIWRHMLFLNNFKHLQLCLTWTWYLAVDFQLFLLNTPFLILYAYRPRWAVLSSVALIFPLVISKTALVLHHEFPPALMLLVPMKQYSMNFAKYSFEIHMRPYTWWPTYLIGSLLGYILFKKMQDKETRIRTESRFRGHYKWNVWFKIISVFLCVIGINFTIFGIYPQARFGLRSSTYDAIYLIISQISWAAGIGWLSVLVQHYVQEEHILRQFLRLKCWTFASNLTFACYLLHLPLGFGLLMRYALEKGGRPRVVLFSSELAGLTVCTLMISYLLSFLCYLLVEGPMANLQRLAMRRLLVGKEKLRPLVQPSSPRRENRCSETLLELKQRNYRI